MSEIPSHLSIVLRPGRCKLGEDRRAQASFAIVAVVLLVLSGASYLVFSTTESKTDRMHHDRQTLTRMYECASSSAAELEETAYQSAIESCTGIQSLNATLLEDSFLKEWASTKGSLFPGSRDGFTIDLLRCSLHLDFLRLAQEDGSGSYSGRGELEWGVEAVPSYFSLDGNYSLRISDSSEQLTLHREVQRHIYLPLPLLIDRLTTFDGSMAGGKNRLENMVRYELSSLAQWRALNGHGATSVTGGKGTSSLLTDEDVRLATALAIVVTEMECFGTVDPASTTQALARFPVQIALDEFLGMFKGNRAFDPADLFLLLNGACDIDPRAVISQTLFAAADLLALRWLDYFQILDLAREMERLATDACLALNGILERITGSDLVMESVIAWMSDRLQEAGHPEYDYRWMNEGPMDATIFVPRRSIQIERTDGAPLIVEVGGYRTLDFPTMDVLALECWKEFAMDYRQNTFELASALRQFIMKMASRIMDGYELPIIRLELDPFDGQSMMEDVEASLRTVLASEHGLIEKAARHARDEMDLRDPLGEALVQYIQAGWREIFEMNASVEYAIDDLASSMIEDCLNGLDGHDDIVREDCYRELASSMKTDGSWGVREAVEEAFSTRPLRRVGIFTETFGNITCEGIPRPLEDAISELARGMIEKVPGMWEMLTEACLNMLKDGAEASGLRSDKILAEPAPGIIILSLGGNSRAREQIQPTVEIPWLAEPSSLSVKLSLPTYSTIEDVGRNLHITDPGNVSLAAYQAVFQVEVHGSILVSLRSAGDLSDLSLPLCQGIAKQVQIGFGTAMTCSTSWPLQGVNYVASATFLGDAGKFFGDLWKGMTSVFGWLADAANGLFSLLQDILSKIVAYAVQAIQAVSDFLMSLVQGVKDLLDGALGSLIGWIGGTIVERLGTTSFRIGFGGLSFVFDFSDTDIHLGRSKEYLRVTMGTALFGTWLTVQARFLDIYREGPDLIANISLVGAGWRAECVIDPRMMVMDHFVEVRGVFQDFVLEMSLPVIVAYEKKSLRLSDVPGLAQILSNIPVPVPGLTASIDAGFEIKYDSPFSTHIVINEVELNPVGQDRGREWVEIYNPSNQAVDLDGWTLGTAHGVQSISIMEGERIEAKSHLVVEFPGQSLDNGGENGYPLGESIALYDPAGRKVDSMPFQTDFFNDARTWQRAFDASDRWEFKTATRGMQNGLILIDNNDLELWQRALLDAVLSAFKDMGGSIPDLSSLAELIKTAIVKVVNAIIQMIAVSIVEMSLFVEVALQDYSQTVDGRLRLALAITGDGMRDALLWIAETVGCALNNLLNPAAVATRAHGLRDVLDDVYVIFGAFGGVGIPKLFSPLAGDQRFLFGAQIEVNLATFLASSHGTGNWAVHFGALFREVPGALLATLCPIDANKIVDCWVLRATVRALNPEERAALS